MPRLRLPRSAFGLNDHGGRQCCFPCVWLCLFSFPGGRPSSSSGRGRHVVRQRRGCLKDGLAEAAAAAAGGCGGGSWGSGSVEPSPLGVRPVYLSEASVPEPCRCSGTFGDRLGDSARPSEETRRCSLVFKFPDHFSFPPRPGAEFSAPRLSFEPRPKSHTLCSLPSGANPRPPPPSFSASSSHRAPGITLRGRPFEKSLWSSGPELGSS